VDRGRLKRAAALLAALFLGGAIGAWLGPAPRPAEPDPLSLAYSTLLSARDQGRIVIFQARYAAVVSASETHLGLRARKTLIMPATVRYGVDLTRLKRADLAWDPPTRTLSVTLPALEISVPSVDFGAVQEFSDGGLAMAISDAGRSLDEANSRSAQAELMRQARAAAPMRLARDAAMRTVARSFAMPLRAAGVDASVSVRFLDPAGREEAWYLDRPRGLEERLRDRQANH